MLGTYASVLLVCGASLSIGQAAVVLCGRRCWSWLSPAVGLALVCALCWATARAPGDGLVSALSVLAAALVAAAYLRGRVGGGAEALAAGLPIAATALVAASLPFLVEGRFGILGTSFNPDMSQHLLATSRLTDGAEGQLLAQGYPLAPHAVVAALHQGLGVGLVHGFDGLTVAVAVLASLTALGAFAGASPGRRLVGALLVGIPYMVASYFAQGAFKETIQALFILAFALGLLELSSRDATDPHRRQSPLRAVPLALIAAGSVFAYSFPGLAWLLGTLAIWAALELLWERRGAATALRAALRPALLALLAFAVLVGPELGRMVEFGGFETFDPAGPGLGNLFGQISPFEALGIWPSGDFRLTPGDGSVPAPGYHLGVALALVLLAAGIAAALARREAALLAALGATVTVYAAARLGGTAYTAAKAVAMIGPPAMAVTLRPLALGWLSHKGLRLGGVVFAAAAAVCSLVALANAPVGPSSYSPGLANLRGELGAGPTLILASRDLLEDEHGVPYLAWELRGGRVCIAVEDEAGGAPPPYARFVIGEAAAPAPFSSLVPVRRSGPYRLWRRPGPLRGASECPLIAVRQARRGSPQG